MKIGIIGGTGFENPEILHGISTMNVNTKWGKPSSDLLMGRIGDNEVVVISRHGKKHAITPTHVNNRANIMALKEAGCTHIIATTACGSLREEIKRGDIVFLDQFIDYTKHRVLSFSDDFENGVIHTPMADPFCEDLRKELIKNAQLLNLNYHKTGTVITIEGPRFSTRAESNMFRMFGADVINMSTAPEAILANEANIKYAAIAMSTDYDSWKTDEIPVTWDEVLKVFNQNVNNVITLIVNTINNIKQ
ncbi:MAG: methylthioadenosine phosphorylase [Bacteroidetes bacterium GWE2_29_8]|nr:MAG: methylthioadenosine phosphorylase [Bacteroidetes bacterium GWE2_29_8]OFY17181.1 MAG: methylthioadenosine phosphorylase [Bacteroidetes bacterium GWF2_29_10]